MQVDPIKPTLKAHGMKRLKLRYDELLLSFAFNLNLRRYNQVQHLVTDFHVPAAYLSSAQSEGDARGVLAAGAYTRSQFSSS